MDDRLIVMMFADIIVSKIFCVFEMIKYNSNIALFLTDSNMCILYSLIKILTLRNGWLSGLTIYSRPLVNRPAL